MRTTPREVCNFKKVTFKLSKIQKAVLVGTILGDGSLKYRGKYCRLYIKHAYGQLPLAQYKHQVFSSITTMKMRVFKQKVGIKDYAFAEFVSLTHPVFTQYYNLFYPLGKKVVPLNIENILLHPLSLAVWVMDDGSAEYAGASLQTHGFDKKGVERLMRTIKKNFGLKVTKRKNKGKWIIYFPKISLPKLKLIIGKYMLPEFKYKLEPYSIRNKPRRDYTPESGVTPDHDIVRT
jgi:hypothetical protein